MPILINQQNIDNSLTPSRHLAIQLGFNDDLESFLMRARIIGDIQNIDLHKFPHNRTIVVSFFDLKSAVHLFSQLSTNIVPVSYLSEFNDFEYIDYINSPIFNQSLVLDFLGSFGKILEYLYIKDTLVVRYFDVRSLKSINHFIRLQERDRRTFTCLNRSLFPELEEKFILQLLKNISILSKENSTDILLRNSGAKYGRNLYNPYVKEHTKFTTSYDQPLLNPLNEISIFSQVNSENKLSHSNFSKNPHFMNANGGHADKENIPISAAEKKRKNMNFHASNFSMPKSIYERTLSNQSPWDRSQFSSATICGSPAPYLQFLTNGDFNKELYQLMNGDHLITNNYNQKETRNTSHNQQFSVNLERIANGMDNRRTIMVRNIPNRYNQEEFLHIIDGNYKGLYDFVYLPMDFKNLCNIGYAFINFIDSKHILQFFQQFHNKRWEIIRSEKVMNSFASELFPIMMKRKVCQICYARIQGRNELISHFKKSGVMSASVVILEPRYVCYLCSLNIFIHKRISHSNL